MYNKIKVSNAAAMYGLVMSCYCDNATLLYIIFIGTFSIRVTQPYIR